MKFNEMNLSSYILDGLTRQKFSEPTEIQEKCIPLIMEGKDVIGASHTGSGKTYAFGIPALEKLDNEACVQILVICPTRELAAQVAEEFRKLTALRENAKIVPIVGGSSMERQIFALKKNARIVVGTPGRIMDHIRRKTLKLEKVKMVVLDEADEMLDMGFKEDIEEILKHTGSQRQTVMFSATMPKAILDITNHYMKDPIYVESETQGKAQTFIDQYFLNVAKNDKSAAVKLLLNTLKPMRAIVFCNTKAMVDALTAELQTGGFAVIGLHGDMRQSDRRKAIDAIKAQRLTVLVATDVAARGIDIKDVDTIINYDLPNNREYYVHRIGRTARAGKTGSAYTIISGRAQLIALEQLRRETKNEIPEYECELTEKSRTDHRGERAPRRNSGERGRRRESEPEYRYAGEGNFGSMDTEPCVEKDYRNLGSRPKRRNGFGNRSNSSSQWAGKNRPARSGAVDKPGNSSSGNIRSSGRDSHLSASREGAPAQRRGNSGTANADKKQGRSDRQNYSHRGGGKKR